MGSLQEQLLEAGLVSAEQLEQSRKKNKPHGKHGGKSAAGRGKKKLQGKKRSAGRGPNGSAQRSQGRPQKTKEEVTLEEAYRERQKLERKEVEQTKQRQQREQEQRRQRNLKLDEIVKDKTLNDSNADVRRYFEYGSRIRHLYVTKDQLAALAEDKLGIVVLRGRYLLVDPEVLAEFKALAPDLVPDLAKDAAPEEAPAEEATSSDSSSSEVPDDLRW
ncbi:MAG: DUF2058 family protein [Xanthomonadales bacterium]|nr:DUF2058 family protein [Xanthomonadales bacterium]